MNRAPVTALSEETVYLSGGGARRPTDTDVLPPHHLRRRAFALVLLTLVLPGSAQLALGHRGLGRLALRVWLALGAVTVLLAAGLLVSRTTVLGLLVREPVLDGIQVVLWAWAALWALLFLDAWRLGRPATLVVGVRRWLTGVTAALLVVTSGGLVYAANAVGSGRDALNAVFQGGAAVHPTHGRYNILLLGADTGRNRVGTRPDSIQVASVDARTGRTVTFGFARDTENINFRSGSVMQRLMPEGWNCGDQCLLNALYTWAEDHRALFPAGTTNPGVLATREAVEALSGLTIHYYVMIDLKGFQQMIDAMGGLDINVVRRTPIGGGSSPILGWIEAGRQHLDGRHALWYARSRTGSTNYERMARQRCVMTAMVQQLDPQTVLLRFRRLASATSGVLQTDLPQSELPRFAALAMKARAQKITSVNFVPPLIKPWQYDPRVVTDTVAATIRTSEKVASSNKADGNAKAGGRAATTAGMTTGVTAVPEASVRHSATTTVDPKDAGGPPAQSDLASVCAAAES
jgi:LCP family protein required for cell wall assembly